MLADRIRSLRTDAWFAALGAALVACAVMFAVLGTPPLPPAPMVLAGIPSPLTGMTRSFVAMASGDVVGAATLHPLGPLCFGACLVAPISAFVASRTGKRPALVDRVLAWRPSVWVVAIAFALAWARQIAAFA